MRVNGGTDYQANQLGGTALAASFNYIGGSANGLIRKQATFGHTTGAASYTETATFTGNGNDTYPVTLKKVAYFTAVTAGTMGFEDAITDATLNASGDQVTTTQTVTL